MLLKIFSGRWGRWLILLTVIFIAAALAAFHVLHVTIDLAQFDLSAVRNAVQHLAYPWAAPFALAVVFPRAPLLRTRSKNTGLQVANDFLSGVSAAPDLAECFARVERGLRQAFDLPAGLILLHEETKAALVLGHAWGFSQKLQDLPHKLPVSTPPYDEVLLKQTAVSLPDWNAAFPNNAWIAVDLPAEARFSLLVPLLAHGENQGILQVFSPTPALLAPERIAFLGILGQQLGLRLQNARFADQIRTSRERLTILSQRFIQVQEAERRHIARELHDQVGQALTALKVNIQSIQRAPGSAALDDPLDENIGMIDRIIQQVRSLSLELRPSLLDDLGVVATIRWFVDRQARRAGFQAEVIADTPEMRLPSELETACFRIVQEAVTNVVRHAQATRVTVELRRLPDGVSLVIADNGVGFDVRAARERGTSDASLGLMGMEERALLMGGVIEIRSNPEAEQGTEIRVWLPAGKPDDTQRRAKGRQIE
ncbi:MAG TPA: GAF domain-containing sensor histidine kinase [Anaerolineaceae bacterium]|nr:GAF domain-containing sensor histidine kinase [Anaerolineaceae bacterium]